MGPSLTGRTLAVAVADSALRGALARSLRSSGAAVATHARADLLWESFTAARPSLCLIDLDLPGLDLDDLPRRLRLSGGGSTPAILLTADPIAVSGVDLRGCPLVTIPFRRADLVRKIRDLLGPAGPGSVEPRRA